MEKKGWKSLALDGWDQVLQSAECALAAFREAEGHSVAKVRFGLVL